MRYRDQIIRTVSGLMSALKRQAGPQDLVWFRGHARKGWRLVPSLARNEENLRAEMALIKRFMQNAVPHLVDRPADDWEWIFLMQHHRAPTRLLDWTESPLVALYFAVTDHTQQDGAVWCLDPLALNREAQLRFDFKLELPAFTDASLISYLPTHIHEGSADLNPIAAIGPRSSKRMAAQLGTFTINHRTHTPIENVGKRKHVWRLIVPANAKKRLADELKYLRFSKLTLFPDLDRVADVTREILA